MQVLEHNLIYFSLSTEIPMNVESRTSARTSKLPPGRKLTNLCLYVHCVSIFVLEQPIKMCVGIRNLQKVVYYIVF